MTSFKSLWRNGKPTSAEFTSLLHRVLAGLSSHTLDGAEEELASFRDSMLALARQMSERASVIELEGTVSKALELLREYNHRALRNNQAHKGELKAVMRTMTETLTHLSESRSRSVHQLQFMERELEQATQIDDIRLLRARLITCLDVVREETVRLHSEAQTRSQEVRQQIEHVAQIIEPQTRFGLMDTVTGLPSRRAAEKSIRDGLAHGHEHAVGIFVVNRLSAINAKYGRGAGDEVMLRVANHFAQHLSPVTSLYRWSGPALLAFFLLNNDADAVKRNWAKAAAVKHEVNLDSKQRAVFVFVET
jgi:GGDEF domain-containing protein